MAYPGKQLSGCLPLKVFLFVCLGILCQELPTAEAQCTGLADLLYTDNFVDLRTVDVGDQACGFSGTEQYQEIDPTRSDVKTCEVTTFPLSGMFDKNPLSTACAVAPVLTTSWRSKNTVTQSGGLPGEISILANFTDSFEIQQIFFIFGSVESIIDQRPKAMRYERYDTASGAWIPMAYQADNCVTRLSEIPTAPSPLTAYCSSLGQADKFSTSYLPVNDFPEDFNSNLDFRKNLITSAVRVYLLYPPSIDPLRSGYVVSDFSIRGVCACYGHQTNCVGPNAATCECGGNTRGDNCQECLPLYNNRQWQIGVACEKCECNEYSSECIYHGPKGHGICQNCQENTDGDFCDSCRFGYHRNPANQNPRLNTTGLNLGQCQGFDGTSVTNYNCSSWCIPCDCNINGTIDRDFSCSMIGQCNCKLNVIGAKCDQCKDTFWDLQSSNAVGCTACDCDSIGTQDSSNLCDKVTGKCLCKTNTDGDRCNACKPNTYNLDIGNPDGCTPCDCDPGGATSPQCDVLTGQCTCRAGLGGRDCRTPGNGRFVPKLDYFIYEAEFQTSSPAIVERGGNVGNQTTSTGWGFSLLKPGESITFNAIVTVTGNYNLIVRYQSEYEWSGVQIFVSPVTGSEYQCGGSTIPMNNVFSDTVTIPTATSRGAMSVLTACLSRAATYTVTINFSQTNPVNIAGEILLDSIVFVPVVIEMPLYTQLDPTNQAQALVCLQAAYPVFDQERAALDCQPIEFSIMAAFFDGSQACSCSGQGVIPATSCDPMTGACSCHAGVLSPDCSRCEVYSFGDVTLGFGCQACNCDPGGSTKLSCSQTGLCDCKGNVVGDKCDSCLPDHWGLFSGNGCQPCTCVGDYSLNDACADDGQCTCDPGVGGQNCDQCSDGFYNLTLTGCISCGCNKDGSTPTACHKSLGVCQCKDRVDGKTCDNCKAGFYGLGPWHSQGCLQCVCSGHTDNCTSADGFYDTIAQSTWRLSDPSAVDDKWQGEDEAGRVVPVSDPTIFFSSLSVAQFVMRIKNIPDFLKSQALYFLAPARYLGDKRSAYGREFKFALSLSSSENLLSDTVGDVVFQGKSLSFALVTKLSALPGPGYTGYTIKLVESSFKVDATDGADSTFIQLMETLADLQAIKIRAKFSNKTDAEVDLYQASIQYSSIDNSSRLPVNNVEHCSCPEGYSGQYCEMCASGYRRGTGRPGSFGTCEPCQCNNHGSGTCDMETGKCTCIHNTRGDHCELCKVGFFGDATQGNIDDCSPCMCPGNVVGGAVNVFADQCDNSGVCQNCKTGHQGDRCETCVQGYYGNPTNVSDNNGQCVPCVCNGRADTCDSVTGVCANCRNNTAGKECEICAQPFFGDAMTFSCQECSCTNIGSTGNCNPSSGQCECQPNVQGFSCDSCSENSYNYTSGQGCTRCNCHPQGSSRQQCDLTTGQCPCIQTVTGLQCDSCVDTFWSISSQGCRECGCMESGTANITGRTFGTCDLVTGQCTCARPGIIGRTCDQCSKASKYEYTYVNGIYIGTYPNCELCGECYDGWASKIDQVGFELESLNQEITKIWANYDNSEASVVEPSINKSQNDLETVQNGISARQGFLDLLNSIQTTFGKVRDRISFTSGDLDIFAAEREQLNAELTSLKRYDGSAITSTGATKSVSDTVNDVNTQESAQIVEYNRGNAAWQGLSNVSNSVLTADAKVSEFQSRVAASSQTLTSARGERIQALSIIGQQFNATLVRNSDSLQTSQQSLNDVEATISGLNTNMTEGRNGLNGSQQQVAKMRGLLEERNTALTGFIQISQSAFLNSTLAESGVQAASNQVSQFTAKADQGKSDLSQAVTNLVEAQNLADIAATNLVKGTNLTQTVQGINLRPLSEMQNLTAAIRGTSLNTSVVQQANQDAIQAQSVASEIEQISANARSESSLAQAELDTINRNLAESLRLRQTTQSLITASDLLDSSIKNIINLVGTKASNAQDLAQKTQLDLDSVNTAISEITRCFDSAQQSYSSIQRVVQESETLLTEGSQQNTNNFAVVQNISQELDALQNRPGFALAVQTNTAIDSLQADLDSLQEIADLAALRATLTRQESQISTVQDDITRMESQIVAIITNLEQFSPATTNCVSN